MISTVIAAAALSAQNPTIDDVLLDNFKTATFTTVVGKAQQSELRKINKDFAQSYRFKRMDVQMKEPFKLRLRTKVDDSEIVMVINGSKKSYKIPQARISHTEDNATAPGKRQTAFDFGFLTPGLFKSYLKANYVRTDRRTRDYVFDLFYEPDHTDESRHRVWVDPDTKFMNKREWYSQKGNLRATFYYEEPKMFSGVLLPTKATVKNAEDKFAGSMTYENIKVNVTISDDVFKL